MKSFLRSFFASLLAIVAAILILLGVVASKTGEKTKIQDHSWLIVDLYGSISEYSPPVGVLSEIAGGKGETLQRILSNLDKARVDDRIDGVIFKMSANNGAGRAMMEEMRGAIHKVRDAGKKVYGYSDSMDRGTLYLAAACDSIYMPENGYVSIMGMAVTTEHLLGALEKLDIKPDIHKIKDYKSAAEMFTRKNMSAPARENKEWLLSEYWDLYCDALQKDRGLTQEQLVADMEKALFRPEEAKDAGLIDGLRYWDGMVAALKLPGEDGLRTVSQARYAEEKAKDLGLTGKKKIAVIHAQGMIGGRKSRVDPMLGVMMGHESVVAEIKKAQEDDDIAAIVFRVNSPGGESLASDIISHQIDMAKQVKPVVVSMVDLAASGGYMISYRASKMVADEMTLTGSIGSISGKMNVKGFFDKLGINHDFATKGPNALMMSEYTDFTDDQWKKFTANHWADFNAWLADVADRRGMAFEDAEKLAHGRVWTGRQALDNGLVDALGGLDTAVAMAKELAGIDESEKVTLVHYPLKKSFFEEVMSGGGFSTVANYVIYRFISNDLAETWNMVTSGRMQAVDQNMLR